MKTRVLLRNGCFALLLLPYFSFGQYDKPAVYTYADPAGTIASNVPLNQISTRAWRHFHRLFPAAGAGEYWFASGEGYQVSFVQHGCRYQAWFDPRGGYRYSLHYYTGRDMPGDPGNTIARDFPDFKIDVVTEITDGEKTIYLVKMVNASAIRTLSVCDGKIEVIDELTNGGQTGSPTVAISPISIRSDR
ncbi:MAG TPA: hypothetical protein VHE54_16375 [Puia sp.]|nr:hypothetical protein [Puia sp.]